MKTPIIKEKIILVISLGTALVLTFFVVSPALAQLKQSVDTKANCTAAKFPQGQELDIVSNPDTGLVTVGYKENGIKMETLLDYKDTSGFAGCSTDAKDLLGRVKQYANKINTDTCLELADIVSGNKPIPVLEAGKFDTIAAKNYIKKHCGQ